jgi:hypothetical protein
MIFLEIIFGALFRRWWGEGNGGPLGWPGEDYKALLKRLLGFLLPLVVTLLETNVGLLPALLMAIIIGIGWLAPISPGHAYGTWMIDGHDRYNREHTVMGDFLAMWKVYFIGVTLPVGLLWYLMGSDLSGFAYALLGLLIPAGYYAPKKLYESLGLNSDAAIENKFFGRPIARAFLGGHTVIGEMVLGAILIGGLGL